MQKTLFHSAILTAVAALIAALAAGCSKPEAFGVDGSITDGSDLTLTLSYFDGNAVKQTEVTSLEGKFHVGGHSAAHTLAYITGPDGRVMVAFPVADGDNIKVEIDPSEPFAGQASGSAPAKEFNAWVRDHAVALIRGDITAINSGVAEFVGANPDSPAAAALLTGVFVTPGHEAQADSLLRILGPGARSKALLGSFPDLLGSQLSIESNGSIGPKSLPGPADSRLRFYPRESTLTLLAFTDRDAGRTDSVGPMLRRLSSGFGRRKLLILELSGAADSAAWEQRMEADTAATWLSTWSPVITADRQWRTLAVAALPFFIVTDSTGTQLMRTPSAAAAEAFIERRLNRGKP